MKRCNFASRVVLDVRNMDCAYTLRLICPLCSLQACTTGIAETARYHLDVAVKIRDSPSMIHTSVLICSTYRKYARAWHFQLKDLLVFAQDRNTLLLWVPDMPKGWAYVILNAIYRMIFCLKLVGHVTCCSCWQPSPCGSCMN